MTETPKKEHSQPGRYSFPSLEIKLIGMALLCLFTLPMFTLYVDPGGVHAGFPLWFVSTTGLGTWSVIRVFKRSSTTQSPVGRCLAAIAALAYTFAIGSALQWYIPAAANGQAHDRFLLFGK
jgi:hypothetical protein